MAFQHFCPDTELRSADPMMQAQSFICYCYPLQVDQYVMERHRHRYEVNPTLVPQLEAAGLHFVGKDDSGARMEILELQNHPFFVACQFHPEFKSRPGRPSALFLGLILAACGKLDGYLTGNTIKSPARPPPRKSARLPDGTPLPTC